MSDEPSTLEPMLVITAVVLVLVVLACVQMDSFQPWLADMIDRVAAGMGIA